MHADHIKVGLMKNTSQSRLHHLAKKFGTPLWVYDAQSIRDRIVKLKQVDITRFAQKACSNINILRLMREQGVKVDAVSNGEIIRALAAGYSCHNDSDDIVFTADLLDNTSLDTVIEYQIPVNVGSIDMLNQLGVRAPGHKVWLRINPGFGHGHSKKTNTGGEHSKHGIWYTDLQAALSAINEHRLQLVGLHMHIGSGVDYAHLATVSNAMLELVKAVKAAGMTFSALSAGGGLSVPYAEGDPELDTEHYFRLWDAARKSAEVIMGRTLKLEIEPGRYLVANSGCLLSEVRATKLVGNNNFVLIDAGFNELMRPSMYGSYHGIDLLAPDAAERKHQPTVVAGPLCEAGDVFTQAEGGTVLARLLPQCGVGDLVVIRDTGAYGASMSSNYNTRPLIAEVLIDGVETMLIRRRQRVDELLALEDIRTI
jgi:diaminopimelate decarboxylase